MGVEDASTAARIRPWSTREFAIRRKRGEAGRSGSPPSDTGDRKRGEAGRSGSPPSDTGDRKRGEAGRSGSPPSDSVTVQYIPAPPALAASCPQRWLIRLRSSYPPTAPAVRSAG